MDFCPSVKSHFQEGICCVSLPKRSVFPDIRELEHVPGRSINLAMSVRGLSALNSIGLGAHVASEYGIPMHSRMIHTLKGEMYPVPYGKEGQAIYSVGRRYVNEILLTGNYGCTEQRLKT